VASKSLTFKFAAAIFEFSGAFFLGPRVTRTIRGKFFTASLYSDEPEILMLGLCSSLFCAIITLMLATHFGLPVSTTHIIVCCLMGFSIAAKGIESINKQIARQICMSWLISPVLSGTLGFCFFQSTRFVILTRPTRGPTTRSPLFLLVVLESTFSTFTTRPLLTSTKLPTDKTGWGMSLRGPSQLGWCAVSSGSPSLDQLLNDASKPNSGD
jgi:phosphate/sulfate permease